MVLGSVLSGGGCHRNADERNRSARRDDLSSTAMCRSRKGPSLRSRAGVTPPAMTILWKLAQCADHLTRCHPERSEGPFLGCGHRLLRGAVPARYTRTGHEVPRTAPSARPRTIVVPSLAGGRRGVFGGVHRAARCQHRAAGAAGAGARVRRGGERGELGRHRLSAGLLLQPRGVRSRLGDLRAQAALSHRLRAVHRGVAALRLRHDAAGAGRAARPAGRGRRSSGRQQHDGAGDVDIRGQAPARHRLVHDGAGGRRQRRTDRRRLPARWAGLAMDLLGRRAGWARGLRDGLAGPAAHAGARERPRRDLRSRRRGAAGAGAGAGHPGTFTGLGVAARVARDAGLGRCVHRLLRAVPAARAQSTLAGGRCRAVPRARLHGGLRRRDVGLWAALRHAVPDVVRLRAGARQQRAHRRAEARHHPGHAGAGRAVRHFAQPALHRAPRRRGRHGALPGGAPRHRDHRLRPRSAGRAPRGGGPVRRRPRPVPGAQQPRHARRGDTGSWRLGWRAGQSRPRAGKLHRRLGGLVDAVVAARPVRRRAPCRPGLRRRRGRQPAGARRLCRGGGRRVAGGASPQPDPRRDSRLPRQRFRRGR